MEFQTSFQQGAMAGLTTLMPLATAAAAGGNKQMGKIKSFNYKSGYGFIHEVPGLTNDVYVARDQLPLEWQVSEARMEGVEVMFDVQSMQDGKMHARNVISTQVPNVGQAVSGTVKSYNPVKGFGFFTVEGLNEDVFFSKERVPGEYNMQRLENSKAVFQLQQKKDGKYEALNIQLASIPQQMGFTTMPNDTQKRSIFSNGIQQNPKRQRLETAKGPGFAGGQTLSEDTQYQGSIKSFRESTGYGFIICPQASQDLRFHLRDLVDPSQGAAQNQDVAFFAKTQPDGRLQAHSVQLLGTVGQVCEEGSMLHNGAKGESCYDQVQVLIDQLTSGELAQIATYINTRILTQ